MLIQLWTYAQRVFWIGGVLLTLAAVAEVLDLYLALRELSPLLGTAFASIVGLILLVGAAYLVVSVRRLPRVLDPPSRMAVSVDSRLHAAYLAKYLRRMSSNPNLSEVQRSAAKQAAGELHFSSRRLRDAGDLDETIRKTEESTVVPLLETLQARAEAEIRGCVRDVMLAVTLSPYRGSDILIVLYRNGALMLRLTQIYQGRPGLREQLHVAGDVLRVVAAVNYLNLGRSVLEGLFSRVPFIGTFVDDIAQGVGAGFLTSAAGHALMGRCEAYQGWDQESAVRSLGSRSQRFLADVRDIFTVDVLPELRGRISSVLPASDTEQPGFWDKISEGVSGAIDSTSKGMGSYIVRPSLASGRAVAATGSRFGRGVAATGSRVGRGVRKGWNRVVVRGRSVLRRPRRERGGDSEETAAGSRCADSEDSGSILTALGRRLKRRRRVAEVAEVSDPTTTTEGDGKPSQVRRPMRWVRLRGWRRPKSRT